MVSEKSRMAENEVSTSALYGSGDICLRPWATSPRDMKSISARIDCMAGVAKLVAPVSPRLAP